MTISESQAPGSERKLTDTYPAGIESAITALRRGEAIVYPTETFYAIGVDALIPRALELLFAIKGREAGKPVALIASDAEMAFSVAREASPAARVLAAAFWPGPLTLVLPARAAIASALIGDNGGVGVRVSSHPVARALAAWLGRPITATSANRAGEQPAVELQEARLAVGSKVKVFLDGGRLAGGAPSTVVAVEQDAMRVIRPGAVSEAQIAAALARGGLR
jgi:L-threonylcarbamoyladenylate synthase